MLKSNVRPNSRPERAIVADRPDVAPYRDTGGLLFAIEAPENLGVSGQANGRRELAVGGCDA